MPKSKRTSSRSALRGIEHPLSLIYLDSCLLIYLVEQDPMFSDQVVSAIGREPAARFAISPLSGWSAWQGPFGTATWFCVAGSNKASTGW